MAGFIRQGGDARSVSPVRRGPCVTAMSFPGVTVSVMQHDCGAGDGRLLTRAAQSRLRVARDRGFRKLERMLPRAIFFDMDDTLLDGVTAMTVSWELVCGEYAPRLGCEAEPLRLAIRKHASEFWKDEEAVGHWRVALDDARTLIVESALEAEGWDTSLARDIALEYAAHHREHSKLFEDTVETLEELRAAGYKLGMITNGHGVPQRAKINAHDLARHMDAIVIEGEFGKGKPAGEVFEHAMASLRVGPHESWHVGDNLYADVGGAKAAGMHAVWIHRERLEPREDIPVRPDRVIAHLRELREILL